MSRGRLSRFGVIGQDIVADGYVVATLTENIPASVADAFRFAMASKDAANLYLAQRDIQPVLSKK